jgi:predicted PurR-regulated permease PerM
MSETPQRRLQATAPTPPPRMDWRQLVASALAVMALFALGLHILGGYLHALAWALVFAVALWPLYARLNRRFDGARREATAALFTALVALIVIAPLVAVTAETIAEIRQFIDYARAEGDQGLPPPEFLFKLRYGGPVAIHWWNEHLAHADWAKDLFSDINTASTRAFGAALGANALRRAMQFGVCLLALFFLFLHGEKIVAQSRRASCRLFGARGETLAAQMVASVRGTVNGLVLVALGEGLIMAVVYLLTQTPHPMLLGLLTAFAAMIPFAAAFAVGLAALVAAASVGATAAFVIAVVGAIVIFLADHFVRPELIGNATRMPFLWVLLGILGGVETFQLLGLFLGPAVMAALISLWRDLSDPAPEKTDDAPCEQALSAP